MFQPAASLLVKIANNILKDPFNLKYRQIRLANEKFMEKLLPTAGAVDCLFAMGFEEVGYCQQSLLVMTIGNKEVKIFQNVMVICKIVGNVKFAISMRMSNFSTPSPLTGAIRLFGKAN